MNNLSLDEISWPEFDWSTFRPRAVITSEGMFAIQPPNASPVDEALFQKHTRTTHHKDGWYTIKCKQGLWEVGGPDLPAVQREARHYFMQYLSDGEYDD